MTFTVTEDAFTDLSILRSKAEVALDCIVDKSVDDSKCAQVQTLTYIASDYLSAMGEMIQAMQKSKIAALP